MLPQSLEKKLKEIIALREQHSRTTCITGCLGMLNNMIIVTFVEANVSVTIVSCLISSIDEGQTQIDFCSNFAVVSSFPKRSRHNRAYGQECSFCNEQC